MKSKISPLALSSLLLLPGLLTRGQETFQISEVTPPPLGWGLKILDVNDAGQMTGFASTPAFYVEAFRFSEGVNTPLGTFGGWISRGYAINAAGYVVGESEDLDFQPHAFLYDGATMHDLGTLAPPYGGSRAVDINYAGQVVGWSSTTNGPGQAFIYQNGEMVQLVDFQYGSEAIAINETGTVIGDFLIDAGRRGFVYKNGSATDIGTLGGRETFVVALNNSDAVVGHSETSEGQTHGFLYANGVMTDLGTLGGTSSSAVGVNDRGQVIGTSTDGYDFTHGFIYDGTMIDLGIDTFPLGINGAGEVVGYSGTVYPRAFLWRAGTGMIDLNDLVPDSGWELTSAEFITDSGRIVGRGLLNGLGAWFMMSSGNAAPIANAGPDLTGECQQPITLNGAGSDPDGDALTFEWRISGQVVGSEETLSVVLPVGTYTATLKVTDPSGAFSEDTATISVADTTPPIIVFAAVSPDVLPIPNHELVPVTVCVIAFDRCDFEVAKSIVSVTCNEETSPEEIQRIGPLTVALAASRDGSGTGRVYTITVACTDSSGNASTISVQVLVPKGHGNDSETPLPVGKKSRSN